MSIKQVNERTAFRLSVSFTDPDGLAFNPSTISYRIDDALSGTAIRGTTNVTPASANVSITVSANDSRIVNDFNLTERRIVTVTANDGDTDELNKQYLYDVVNLRYAG